MQCRTECGACCIAPSISSLNKAAGEKCQHLTADYRCTIFNQPERPTVCAQFKPELEFCGENRDQALQILTFLESETL